MKRGTRSIRARIALACAGLFLVVGGVLVAATDALVGHFTPLNAVENAGTAQALRFYHLCRAGHGAGPKSQQQSPDFTKKCHSAEQVAALVGAQAQHGSDRRALLVYSLAGLGVTTVLAGGLGWAVGGRILQPLRQITNAARQASQENLDARLRLAGPHDELKELADTFDAMLARLDAAFASQRRFVANASHELRTSSRSGDCTTGSAPDRDTALGCRLCSRWWPRTAVRSPPIRCLRAGWRSRWACPEPGSRQRRAHYATRQRHGVSQLQMNETALRYVL